MRYVYFFGKNYNTASAFEIGREQRIRFID